MMSSQCNFKGWIKAVMVFSLVVGFCAQWALAATDPTCEAAVFPKTFNTFDDAMSATRGSEWVLFRNTMSSGQSLLARKSLYIVESYHGLFDLLNAREHSSNLQKLKLSQVGVKKWIANLGYSRDDDGVFLRFSSFGDARSYFEDFYIKLQNEVSEQGFVVPPAESLLAWMNERMIEDLDDPDEALSESPIIRNRKLLATFKKFVRNLRSQEDAGTSGPE